MVPLSMTLSDLWPGSQGHDIFEVEKSEKRRVLKTNLLFHTVPNTWNGTMFGDLYWPLNASRGFVSISWASCQITANLKSKPHIRSWKDRIPFHYFAYWGSIWCLRIAIEGSSSVVSRFFFLNLGVNGVWGHLSFKCSGQRLDAAGNVCRPHVHMWQGYILHRPSHKTKPKGFCYNTRNCSKISISERCALKLSTSFGVWMCTTLRERELWQNSNFM